MTLAERAGRDQPPASMTATGDTAEVVARGLSSAQKWLPPVLFYDERGSQLFDEICQLDEYYLTRTERSILLERADALAAAAQAACTVLELGGGSGEKAEILLRPLQRDGKLRRYLALDVSPSALERARARLAAALPTVEVIALRDDYRRGLGHVRAQVIGQTITLFLGGNVGNYDPVDVCSLLGMIRAASLPGDLLLVGVDQPTDRAVLVAAYDDARGVTAEFNRNLLRRLNRELGATFDLDRFEHVALWNPRASRIEMHLRSTCAQTVWVEALAREFSFREGETIHTENSYKLAAEVFERLARDAGWTPREAWGDRDGRFAVHVLEAEQTGRAG